ncbi:BIR protein [Plasmodium berghei]|uniref:BIR protein n=1 Tax=Plasmodium berghei TaxID=5821 RepID=A0A0Y9PZ40_PLABE|nr:BIR protein [Plasmodium berghei]
MAINKVCNKFETMWKLFPDELKDSEEYNFNSGLFKKYCPSENCNNDIDKINAGCLRLFNDVFGDNGYLFDSNTYKDQAACIMIWLGYKLSLKTFESITTLKDFYSKHIENNTKYTENTINEQIHKSYKEVIDAIKEYMDINISHMSKFYKLLKLLCDMDTSYNNENSSQALEHAKAFADEYQKLLNDDNNIDNSSYNKVLLVLSNYYNNFEKGRSYNGTSINLSPLPSEKTPKTVDIEGTNETKTDESSSEEGQSIHVTTNQSSNITLSGSALVNKLIIVLSILVAIPICLGISYKYSLFGFRKKCKKIKKKINIRLEE